MAGKMIKKMILRHASRMQLGILKLIRPAKGKNYVKMAAHTGPHGLELCRERRETHELFRIYGKYA